MDKSLALLSLIVFLPAAGALVLAFIPGKYVETIRYITLAITGAVFATIILALVGSWGGDLQFDAAQADMQQVFSIPWIPSFDISYYMGLDGISFPLIVLTALVCLLAMAASWSITKYVKAYCILFLLLEMGMLGVFLALDFFLFYVFWEVMLLPMYFLIGVWGGTRKEYAAIKFFLYTLLGSVLMLIAILMLYFASDLTRLDAQQLAEAHVLEEYYSQVDSQADHVEGDLPNKEQRLAAAHALFLEEVNPPEGVTALRSKHTFNILALQQMGQKTDLFSTQEYLFDWNLQKWAFLLLLVGFIIKVPSVPVHTWLPDAHVEAPTPISMILAGVLLKMGGYGIIRICYPICPDGGYEFAWLVCGLGLVSMVYGAFAAMAQRDFKRLVAYSSVSHMGYVMLGLGVWSAVPGTNYNSEYWAMGISGAMFQMIAHGISSAGMFFMVGVIYDRVHHRNLKEFGGLFGKMPVYTAFAIGIFFAGLGLPGLCGFIGEVFVVLSVWKYSVVMAIIAASVVILTAGYILWTIQRVYLGAEYKGPHEEALFDLNPREGAVALTLFVLAIVFGVLPHQTLLKYMDKTIEQQTSDLATWTRDVKQPEIAARQQEESAESPAAAQAPVPAVVPVVETADLIPAPRPPEPVAVDGGAAAGES